MPDKMPPCPRCGHDDAWQMVIEVIDFNPMSIANDVMNTQCKHCGFQARDDKPWLAEQMVMLLQVHHVAMRKYLSEHPHESVTVNSPWNHTVH